MYELLVTNVGCGVCRPPYMAAAIIDQRGVSLGARWRVELQTMVRKDFTITEKAPARAFSWLKALLRHYTKQVPNLAGEKIIT